MSLSQEILILEGRCSGYIGEGEANVNNAKLIF